MNRIITGITFTCSNGDIIYFQSSDIRFIRVSDFYIEKRCAAQVYEPLSFGDYCFAKQVEVRVGAAVESAPSYQGVFDRLACGDMQKMTILYPEGDNEEYYFPEGILQSVTNFEGVFIIRVGVKPQGDKE